MATYCPLSDYGQIGDDYFYYAEHCGAGTYGVVSDTRPHTINGGCPDCSDPIVTADFEWDVVNGLDKEGFQIDFFMRAATRPGSRARFQSIGGRNTEKGSYAGQGSNPEDPSRRDTFYCRELDVRFDGNGTAKIDSRSEVPIRLFGTYNRAVFRGLFLGFELQDGGDAPLTDNVEISNLLPVGDRQQNFGLHTAWVIIETTDANGQIVKNESPAMIFTAQ